MANSHVVTISGIFENSNVKRRGGRKRRARGQPRTLDDGIKTWRRNDRFLIGLRNKTFERSGVRGEGGVPGRLSTTTISTTTWVLKHRVVCVTPRLATNMHAVLALASRWRVRAAFTHVEVETNGFVSGRAVVHARKL